MKYLVIFMFTFFCVNAQAQNMGAQYVTSVFSPISGTRISLISENPHPSYTKNEFNYHAIPDSLQVEVEKGWATTVAFEPYGVVQASIVEPFYITSFMVDTSLYYFCRGKECRWATPIQIQPETETDPFTLIFQEDQDWPTVKLTFYNNLVYREDIIKLLPTGETYSVIYKYVDPNVWVHN